MSAKTRIYQRLPGKKKSFLIGYYTLWQAADHLLYIYSRFGVEDYKRLYFSDIQAIVTRKTIVGKIQNVFLAILLSLFLLQAALADGPWAYFGMTAAGLTFILLLINWLRGPTCETRIMTAVQTENLLPLYRLKNALKVMNDLRPVIEQHQGSLQPEILTKGPVRSARQPPRRTGAPVKAARAEKGEAHLILFALLIFDGLLICLNFWIHHIGLTLLGSGVSMAVGICVIIALVRQHGSNMQSPLRLVTWGALGYVCLSFAAGYGLTVSFVVKHPGTMPNQWEMLKVLASASPWDSPLMFGYHLLLLFIAAVLGMGGLFMLRKFRCADQKMAAGPSCQKFFPLSKRSA